MDCSMPFRRALAALTVAAAATGCTSIPFPRQDLPPAAAARIRTLSILRIDDVERFAVPVDISTGQAAVSGLFGPLGVAVLAATLAQRVAARAEPLGRALAAEQASFGDFLADELQRSLASTDLRLQYRREHRPSVRGSDAFDYAAIPKESDAWLHVRFRALGYVNDKSDQETVPHVLVTALLIDPPSGATLFQRSVLAGPTNSTVKELDVLSGSQEPRFASFDALLAAPGPAAEGLRTNIRAIARHLAVAINLRRPALAAPLEAAAGVTLAKLPPALDRLPSSWKVSVEGDPRTRTLTIRGVAQASESGLELDATYGWSDRNDASRIPARIDAVAGGHRLTLVTQANTRITVDSTGADSFSGDFATRSATKRVTLERIR